MWVRGEGERTEWKLFVLGEGECGDISRAAKWVLGWEGG